jgi:Tat protein secretion system quality control protein TatD with DNase activity
MRRHEVRKLVDQVGDCPGVFVPASTIIAFGEMGLDGRHAESELIVEELVNFVGQQVSAERRIYRFSWS